MPRAILRKGGANQRYAAEKDTGLIVDWLADDEQPVIPRRKVYWPEDFGLVFMKEFGNLRKLGLTANEWNVLAWLFEHLEYENWVLVSQKQIAEDCGLRQSHVSTYLKRLCELEVIARDPKNGNRGRYRINSRLMWKGSTKLIPLRREQEWRSKLELAAKRRKQKEKEKDNPGV